LRELEQEFTRELVVIGVHSPKFPEERAPANLRAAVQRLALHHPVVNDAEFRIWQEYAVRAWPTLIFVDPTGRVMSKHEGEFPLDPIRLYLRDAIARFEAAGHINREPLPLTPIPEPQGVLRFPGKVLADQAGDRLFIADSGHNQIVVAGFDGRIRMVVGSGERGLLDGGPTIARFNNPQGMALDDPGRTLYVADTDSNAIRTIDLADGRVATVAGTGAQGYVRSGGGQATATPLSSPWDVAVRDGALWIAMAGLHEIWRLDPGQGWIAVAAGTGAEALHDGTLSDANFAQPSGITALDGLLYVACSEASAVRLIDPMADRVRRLVGRGLFEFGDVDGKGDQVRLQHPLGVCAVREASGPAVYIADTYNSKIKRLNPETRTVETCFGSDDGHADGPAAQAQFWEPGGLSYTDHLIYVADTNNHAIRVCDLDANTVATLEIKP